MVKTLSNEEILELAESVGFEYNDFGKYNCAEDSILELIGRIEEYYNVLENTYDE